VEFFFFLVHNVVCLHTNVNIYIGSVFTAYFIESGVVYFDLSLKNLQMPVPFTEKYFWLKLFYLVV